jgi:N-acetyl sugar amidotransferase
MQEFNMCSRCVMDTSDPDIAFDATAVCNHCLRYQELVNERVIPAVERRVRLDEVVAEVKRTGRGKRYDCVIGVSGGVDSTYVAWLVKELGLRPLAVHLDNGWNSELAVANIEKTLKTLDIDLYTHVVDWEEFRDLQISFLKASTPDGEVPTDHAIFALLYQTAAKHGLRHVFTGVNVVSEGVLPKRWGYGYFDWRYIADVHRRFGNSKLTTYPHFNLLGLFAFMFLHRIRLVPILNYLAYDKNAAMELLQTKLGWEYYGGKHYESIYTRFFQAYVLPRKFSIDKRKAHFSSLICSDQMTREQALGLLKEPVYPERLLQEDLEYSVKKLGLSTAQFDDVLKLPRRSFLDYRNNDAVFEMAKKIIRRRSKRGYLG